MGLVIHTPEDQAMIPQIRLDRKLWLNADKTAVVEDGDPDSAFLYGVEGTLVPRPEAARLGALPKGEEGRDSIPQPNTEGTPPGPSTTEGPTEEDAVKARRHSRNKQAAKPEDK